MVNKIMSLYEIMKKNDCMQYLYSPAQIVIFVEQVVMTLVNDNMESLH